MNNQIGKVKLDVLGRCVINDQILLKKINGAVTYSDLLNLLPDAYCNATCNAPCPKVNPGCVNVNCSCF